MRLSTKWVSKTIALLILLIASLGVFNLLVATYHIHVHFHFQNPDSFSSSLQIIPTRQRQRRRQRQRPPLKDLVQDYNITGDVSWLLDFSIVGFPKCGTSSLMYQLHSHPQVDIYTDERCDLAYNKQALLTKSLYQDFYSTNQKRQRGLKCPVDLESTPLSLPNYQRYFPRTKFIVGLRHPVLWFESFYNFRIHNGVKMLPPQQLVGRCGPKMYNVCTFRGNFHLFLANLGKTRVTTSSQERQWWAPHLQRSLKPLDYGSNVTRNRHVFLYEVSQLKSRGSSLSSSSSSSSSSFLVDLQHYLGLEEPFPPSVQRLQSPLPPEVVWFRPGQNNTNQTLVQERQARKIDICDPSLDSVRRVLMEQAVNASSWILQYFVSAPRVVVSNPRQFRRILWREWTRDPCVERKRSQSSQSSSSSRIQTQSRGPLQPL